VRNVSSLNQAEVVIGETRKVRNNLRCF